MPKVWHSPVEITVHSGSWSAANRDVGEGTEERAAMHGGGIGERCSPEMNLDVLATRTTSARALLGRGRMRRRLNRPAGSVEAMSKPPHDVLQPLLRDAEAE